MAKSHGYRSGTRHSFSRSFRKRGVHIPLKQYLTELKVGDYVDVKANGAIHKGMPHKTYHGRTGIVFNVSRRAVGVEINKQVRNRIIKKRINVRVEHVHPSKCRIDFLNRVSENDRVSGRGAAGGAGGGG
jgi:large subunit ribosomal protein L21e